MARSLPSVACWYLRHPDVFPCFSPLLPTCPNPFCVSWRIGGLPQPQRWKGSPWFKGWDGDGLFGMGGKDADFAAVVCFQDLPLLDFGSQEHHRKLGCTDLLTGFKWPNSERPSGNAEFCQAHGVWRPWVSWTSFTGPVSLWIWEPGLCLYSCTNPPLEDVFEL